MLWNYGFWVARAAAKAAGVQADILDLRSLMPLDLDAIVSSVNKTGRCIVLHEATRTSGFGGRTYSRNSAALLLRT